MKSLSMKWNTTETHSFLPYMEEMTRDSITIWVELKSVFIVYRQIKGKKVKRGLVYHKKCSVYLLVHNMKHWVSFLLHSTDHMSQKGAQIQEEWRNGFQLSAEECHIHMEGMQLMNHVKGSYP